MHGLLLLSLLLSAPADESAPASVSPYRLIVCLRISDDPLLTPLLAESVRREVRDQLRNFFGPLADVEVLTTGHWLIDDYARDDVELPQVDAEILEARGLVEQVCLFRISFDGKQYRVRGRQMDGQTGVVGTIREAATPDRQWISKTICLAVRDDFALRATVEPGSIPGTANIRFVGREHQDYLQRIIGDACVMQLYWVAKTRGGTDRTVVPRTLLLWKKDAPANVVSTYASPWSRKAGVTYEAVRLHTQRGRLRLRVVDDQRGTPIVNRTVSANDQGFRSLNSNHILPLARRDGTRLSPELQHVAYVRVDGGGGSFIHIPLPITAAVCDHTLPIPADKTVSERNDYDRDLRFLSQDIQTMSAAQSLAVRAANDFNERKRYEDALQSVHAAVDGLGPQLTTVEATLQTLVQLAEKLAIKDRKILSVAGEEIQKLQERHRELVELGDTIRNAVATRDAQQRANVLIKLGEQFERDADFAEAIEKYELALAERVEQPELARKLEQLKAEWTIKGDDHRAARALVYEQWATSEITDLEERLPEVQKALETLRSVPDGLTARKLVQVNAAHVEAIQDLVAQLAGRSSKEDQAETKKYAALLERLAEFQAATAQFVSDSLTPSAPAAASSAEPDAPAAPVPTEQAPSPLLDLE